MNLLLAIMSDILARRAQTAESWGKDAAMAVAESAMTEISDLGIDCLFENKRLQLCGLQSGLLRLSSLRKSKWTPTAIAYNGNGLANWSSA